MESFYIFLGILGCISAVCLVAWVLDELKWTHIERVNRSVGITRWNAYLDRRGYLRWRDTKQLCHREIAYHQAPCTHSNLPFSALDVHHRNEDILGNTPPKLASANPQRVPSRPPSLKPKEAKVLYMAGF